MLVMVSLIFGLAITVHAMRGKPRDTHGEVNNKTLHIPS